MSTGQEIRNIGSLAWEDPLAILEPMNNSRWKKIVREENKLFRDALHKTGSVLKETAFKTSTDSHTLRDIFKQDRILITPNGTNSYTWRWNDDTKIHEAAAIVCEGDTVWAVEPDSAGKEIYTLVSYKYGQKTPIWTYSTSIGPFLIVRDRQCYCIEANGELRYGTVVSVNAGTGLGRRFYYKEENKRYNCRLIAGENRCIFVQSENAGHRKLFVLESSEVRRLEPQSECFFPVGYSGDEVCYFHTRGDNWEAEGKALKAFSVPKNILANSSFVFLSIASQFLIVSSNGSLFMYELRHSVKPKLLYKILGNCLFHEQQLFEGGGVSLHFCVSTPGAYPVYFSRPSFGNLAMTPIRSYANASSGITSKGVPYVLVLPVVGKPTHLMTIVYGGYGLPSKLATSRWKPYLDCGWALVFALVRGGGDRDESWAQEGRTYKKYNSIYDTEDVIRAAQKKLDISWKRTCLFGRSAGGYVVGSIVARHGEGDLIGGAYTEVPYVDILRTTTNTELPLTLLEYDEFGDPSSRIEDFSTIVRFSPVDSLPKEGAPKIFVLSRTSVNDREVLAYESVKWITRLRGFPSLLRKSAPKLLSITDKEGHFVRGSTATRQMSEDLNLLNSFFQVACAKKSQLRI